MNVLQDKREACAVKFFKSPMKTFKQEIAYHIEETPIILYAQVLNAIE